MAMLSIVKAFGQFVAAVLIVVGAVAAICSAAQGSVGDDGKVAWSLVMIFGGVFLTGRFRD
jgi:hypothetical protein